MRELSLFSGAGGGLLGTKLLGFIPIGYVEIDDFCQKVIRQRIKDGLLENAPIFTDIRAFIDSGCAELYRGITDVITAGFPCQIFSVAGTGEGRRENVEENPRNLWPATRDCIGVVRPQYILLENVPGLLVSEYIWRILSEITALGYDSKWGIISAADTEAPHLRKRWWLVGHAKCNGTSASKKRRGT